MPARGTDESLLPLLFTQVPSGFVCVDVCRWSHVYGCNVLSVRVCPRGMHAWPCCWMDLGTCSCSSLASVGLQDLAHPKILHAVLGSISSVI